MTVITPAIGIQGGSHSAQAFRQLASALAGQDVETFVNTGSTFGVAQGVVRSGHYAVSEKGTPDMSVDVAAGIAFVTGDQSLAQGVYAITNDAPVNVSITTADGTNARYDLVCVQVRDDDEDGGGNNDARLMVVDGTPAGTPADPTIPDGCLVLARVIVDASVASIVDGKIGMIALPARASNWNQAWGLVGYATVTSSQTVGSTVVDRTGLSAEFAAVEGRRYKTTAYMARVTSNGGVVDAKSHITGPFGTQYSRAIETITASGYDTTLTCIAIHTGSSTASDTRKCRVSATGSGASFYAASDEPSYILVEDSGPA